MSKSSQLYAHPILDHNYLGEIDSLTIKHMISEHLPSLEACVRQMLAEEGE